jgi:hypothetical protein
VIVICILCSVAEFVPIKSACVKPKYSDGTFPGPGTWGNLNLRGAFVKQWVHALQPKKQMQ